MKGKVKKNNNFEKKAKSIKENSNKTILMIGVCLKKNIFVKIIVFPHQLMEFVKKRKIWVIIITIK